MTEPLSEDVKQIGKLDPQKKAFLAAFLFLLFIVSVLVGANLSKKSKTAAPDSSKAADAAANIAPKTRLALSPSAKTLKVGATQTVSVDLLELPVTAADIVLTFDPLLLAVSNIQNGTVFDRVLVRKVEKGSVIFSAAVNPESAASISKGTMLTFTVKALKPSAAAAIEFDTQKTITALNGSNTLGLSTGSTFKIE